MDKKETEKNPVYSPSSSSADPTSKIKPKSRGRKRKRCSSSSDDNSLVLPDNAMETERNVHASAVKNNLDEISVRKILKKVVSNEHVLALVQLREEEEGDSGSDDKTIPKLTRAKAKELKKVSPRSAPWNLENLELTPINHIPVKTRPEVKALIAQELPDDEDDEEYEPTPDDALSDDDHEQSCSDLESQPRTPATPARATPSPNVHKDGPFKVPLDVSSARRKLVIDEEEATIALRTRSKLSLSTTTIEHIESEFVPPDDIPPQVDGVWSQFLNDCFDASTLQSHEEDDEADPEYNAAADADALDEDEEALGNSLIKISKKELNDLVTELFSIMPAPTDEELGLESLANAVLTDTSRNEGPRWEGKVEPLSDDESKPSKGLRFEKGNNVTRFSPGKREIDPHTQMTTRSSARGKESTVAREKASGKVQEVEKPHSICSLPQPPKEAVADAPRPERTVPSMHICIEEVSTPSLDPSSLQMSSALQDAPPLLRSRIEPTSEVLHIQLQTDVIFSQEQMLILQQQLRQHIQLAASNFMQLNVHPVHWSLAPYFKEYLTTLAKLSQANEKSVVKVCNLEPAMELVETWEKSTSDDTPENRELLEFISSQVEKSRRRYANNSFYVGEFPETFKKVVANSSVFLYPYLLPPMPYRADNTRRVTYLRSEDELIVLGLDQFWRYMDANPTLFRRPKVHSRHRWGLSTALQLVCKHMFPWITPKLLGAHIACALRHCDKHNPIFNYIKRNEINAVKHTILPFNPSLTLYDQPEHEIPRVWLRYLSKTCKRFRQFLSRRGNYTTRAPAGVPVEGITPDKTVKKPLPNDFTKKIYCHRNRSEPPEITEAKMVEEPPNIIKIVQTSTGPMLMCEPLVINRHTETDVLNQSDDLDETEVTGSDTPTLSKSDSNPKDKDHCTCCVLLRRICKKQTVITDYFGQRKNETKKCHCSDIKYPKMTKKLRLLVNNFKNSSKLIFKDLERRLEQAKRGQSVDNEADVNVLNKTTLEELVAVSSFHMKILTRSLMSKNSYLKFRVMNLLTKFEPTTDDPLQLATGFFAMFKNEMVDLYMDFLGFLTAEQADKLDKFKDYFTRTCVKDLMDNVDEHVQNNEMRHKIITQIKNVFFDSISTSCEICTRLLENMTGYSKLAEYTFSLFPHRKKARMPETPAPTTRCNTPASESHEPPEDSLAIASAEAADEADAKGHENEDSSNQPLLCNVKTNEISEETTEQEDTTIKTEADYAMDIDENHEDNALEGSERQTYIITLEEESIKHEPAEWKREEDKHILEVLQQELTPQERKVKTISEILEEKNVIDLISESMAHKSREDVKERVLYILSLLVQSER